MERPKHLADEADKYIAGLEATAAQAVAVIKDRDARITTLESRNAALVKALMHIELEAYAVATSYLAGRIEIGAVHMGHIARIAAEAVKEDKGGD